jgi:hypothetical protein
LRPTKFYLWVFIVNFAIQKKYVMKENIYPDQVEKLLKAMDESFREDGFYTDFEIEDKGIDALYEVGGPILMKLWVKGELEDMPDEILEKIMKQTAAMGLFLQLRSKGMINWVPDEKGDDVIFLTQKGRDALENDETI